MQERVVHSEAGHSTALLRNIAYATGESRPHLDTGRTDCLKPVVGCSTTRGIVVSGDGSTDDRSQLADFVRCSYLGLDNHPVIVGKAIEAQRSLHSSTARTRLNFDLLGDLEAALSELFWARVVVFSSGMLANLGAMSILASGQLTGGTKPVVVFDSFAHISLACHKPLVADETRVETIAHNDMDALERLCSENAVVAYVCDGVYSTGGHSPLKALCQLQERYGLFLYIDDAHGITIVGRQGEGFARSHFSTILGERTIIAASLTKGFGASGGMLMLGTTEQEALFRRCCIPYMFSAPPTLAAIGAALGSCKIHHSTELGERQRRLAQRIKVFDRRVATAEQGNSLPIRRIVIGSEANALAVARGLLDRGFYTQMTLFPKLGQETAGIRVRITVEHEVSDIERLCNSILETVDEITEKPYPLR
ncbi:7-keto-8-aminopelargonate synthetase-like enzyme [Bradyrhizobium sp. USDA 4532]|uniref:aminotransferase class I/II-fold pyridoxal phosphate-dependent enzyme n=1 Tax=unclassified Bradyrhizobium TaxID=2631580 RepID=UPI00209FE3F9|nr:MULTISPECIES: aminotransferase class I/II-fold pyridoxal phosphate-dependent enzyme [unclassified Bradyrhizobium]MCP1835527.1 7-keto-8-aminopelargonate synthetase-like enzyme [Bradyrhizobium sp. USDA 4545]MCP1920274.1 7-keto-8-aminopelargonate synthetase-like enzyme [Bradyrhizobium sp. USDA 4532]